jgi:hypothetical protein
MLLMLSGSGSVLTTNPSDPAAPATPLFTPSGNEVVQAVAPITSGSLTGDLVVALNDGTVELVAPSGNSPLPITTPLTGLDGTPPNPSDIQVVPTTSGLEVVVSTAGSDDLFVFTLDTPTESTHTLTATPSNPEGTAPSEPTSPPDITSDVPPDSPEIQEQPGSPAFPGDASNPITVPGSPVPAPVPPSSVVELNSPATPALLQAPDAVPGLPQVAEAVPGLPQGPEAVPLAGVPSSSLTLTPTLIATPGVSPLTDDTLPTSVALAQFQARAALAEEGGNSVASESAGAAALSGNAGGSIAPTAATPGGDEGGSGTQVVRATPEVNPDRNLSMPSEEDSRDLDLYRPPPPESPQSRRDPVPLGPADRVLVTFEERTENLPEWDSTGIEFAGWVESSRPTTSARERGQSEADRLRSVVGLADSTHPTPVTLASSPADGRKLAPESRPEQTADLLFRQPPEWVEDRWELTAAVVVALLWSPRWEADDDRRRNHAAALPAR